MSESTGKLIDDTGASNGNPAANPDTLAGGGTQGRTDKPEVIYGYDVEGPSTVKLSGDGDAGEPRRTKSGRIDGRTLRGRRKSGEESGAEKSSDLAPISLNLEDLLYSLHLMGAEFLKTEELALDKDEAKELAKAIKIVGSYHAMKFDPRKMAYFNLATVMATVYGTRLVAILNKNRSQKQGPTPINKPVQQKQAVNGPTPEIRPDDIFALHFQG